MASTGYEIFQRETITEIKSDVSFTSESSFLKDVSYRFFINEFDNWEMEILKDGKPCELINPIESKNTGILSFLKKTCFN